MPSKSMLRIAITCLALAAPLGAYAQSDDIDQVTKLVRSGQLEQAATRADAYLATKPKDAQMRFLKGVILTDQKKTTDAIGVFIQLSTDFPELPEPYNNLAVIYAAQGEYEKARSALEMAIRVAPSWATAHENLGDVYVKLAAQSYEKVAQLEPQNANAARKLSLARELGTRASTSKH